MAVQLLTMALLGCRCVICQMRYKRGDQQIKLPCKHVYHSECISKWLSINKVGKWFHKSWLFFRILGLQYSCPWLIFIYCVFARFAQFATQRYLAMNQGVNASNRKNGWKNCVVLCSINFIYIFFPIVTSFFVFVFLQVCGGRGGGVYTTWAC